jgi:hypothetical protein
MEVSTKRMDTDTRGVLLASYNRMSVEKNGGGYVTG